MIEVVKVEDCGEKIGDYDIPIHNAIIVPDNATNGDMIKALFPNAEVRKGYVGTTLDVDFGENNRTWFERDWWNAPYKAESDKEENE